MTTSPKHPPKKVVVRGRRLVVAIVWLWLNVMYVGTEPMPGSLGGGEPVFLQMRTRGVLPCNLDRDREIAYASLVQRSDVTLGVWLFTTTVMASGKNWDRDMNLVHTISPKTFRSSSTQWAWKTTTSLRVKLCIVVRRMHRSQWTCLSLVSLHLREIYCYSVSVRYTVTDSELIQTTSTL